MNEKNHSFRLIVDFSSIIGACLHSEDIEYGTEALLEREGKADKLVHIPSPEHVLQVFQSRVLDLGIPITQMIIVKDPGETCKVRRALIPEYKVKEPSMPPEFYTMRKEAMTLATTWLKENGAIVATPKDSSEADDLINELAKRLSNTMIWTRDRDLLACPTDVLYQGKDGTALNPQLYPVDNKYIRIYKTLVTGDASDCVKGCQGWGPVTWDKMIEQFGDGVVEVLNNHFESGELEALKGYASEYKPFQKVYAQLNRLKKVYKVLGFLSVPAHRVRWEGGMLKGESTLVTAQNYESTLQQIKGTSFTHSTIDYESDVCDESRAWSKSSGVKVDVMASKISGMGLRIRDQNFYFSVNHKDTDNITLDQLGGILQLLMGKPIWAHNSTFENTLTYNHFDVLLPGISDTVFMASYVDENDFTNLKHLSKKWLDYQQTSYVETVGDKSGMSELTALEVVNYGIDDVITTDSLRNLFEVILQYEGTLDTFHQIEDAASYFTTMCFIHGVEFDAQAYKELNDQNTQAIEQAWTDLSRWLLSLGWEGGQYKPLQGFNFPEVNRIYKIIHGQSLTGMSAVKTAIREMDDRKLAALLEAKDAAGIDEYAMQYFKPSADFNIQSPKQMHTLLYEKLRLPVRITNAPTDRMRTKGILGNPATNEIAIQNAIVREDSKYTPLLQLLLHYKGLLTKRGLFLEKYPGFVHWETGRLHASLRQTSTTTRRYTCSAPNLQQLPKRAGKEFRNMLKSREGYTLCAFDFTGQELCLAADDSQDEAFLNCYIGDSKKDVHSLTGLMIAKNSGYTDLDYGKFMALLQRGDEEIKDLRTLGKKINFTCQYGAQAEKVAHTLCIDEGKAKVYITSREQAFPQLIKRVSQWHTICKRKKYATTMLGVRRHLDGRDYYGSLDNKDRSAADRLAYSMRIQGSAAEMTKLAAGEMYRRGLFDDDRVLPAMVIHDEIVLQIRDEWVDHFVPTVAEIMCQQYADMKIKMTTEPETGKSFGLMKPYKP